MARLLAGLLLLAALARADDAGFAALDHRIKQGQREFDTLDDYRDRGRLRPWFGTKGLEGSIDAYLEAKQGLERRGFEYSVAYAPAAQYGTQGGTNFTANHELAVAAQWRLVDGPAGRGRVQASFVHQRTLGGTTTREFSLDLGTTYLTNDADTTPDDATNRLGVLWWEHFLADDRLRLVVGKVTASELVDGNRFAGDDREQFLMQPLASNPVSAVGDAQGLGAFVAYYRERWGLKALVMDAQQPAKAIDFESFADGRFHYVAEFSVFPRVPPGIGTYRFSLHYTDQTGSTPEESAGWGFSLSFDQEIKEEFGGFFRYAWQDRRRNEYKQMMSTGVLFLRPAGRASDEVGAGIFWVQVQNTPRGNEYGFEYYWRMQWTRYLELTPSAQVVMHPSRTTHDDLQFVFGLRLRLVF